MKENLPDKLLQHEKTACTLKEKLKEGVVYNLSYKVLRSLSVQSARRGRGPRSVER